MQNIKDNIYLDQKDFEKEGVAVSFEEKIRKDRMDSFFYDGVVAVCKKEGIEVEVIATGEIRIWDYQEENYIKITDNKEEIIERFSDYFDNDNVIESVYEDSNGKLSFENNNWFELNLIKDDKIHNLGVVYHELDSVIIGAIESLENYLKKEFELEQTGYRKEMKINV